MQNAVLALNAGSSSVKFSLLSIEKNQSLQLIVCGEIEELNNTPHFIVKNKQNEIITEQSQFNDAHLLKTNPHHFAFQLINQWLANEMKQISIVAAGHRVVHGAATYIQPTIITPTVIDELEKLIPLAPLHQPYNIAGIKSLLEINPNILQVACFDTAFHVTQPEIAQTFAIPRNLSPIPIKRYGFHGLSYEYIAHKLPELLGDSANGKTIVGHLGAGASLCAMLNCKSIATTMGFTALDGLPMATRCGNIDPGIILYLMQKHKMSADEITDLLYNRSGLLGLSNISSDVRILLKSNEPAAKLAIDLFIYHIQREIGSLIAALGGLDNLIFTAGIGEHSAEIRARVCNLFSWLGMKIDTNANLKNSIKISTCDSKISAWVIPTNEELMIAQQTYQCHLK